MNDDPARTKRTPIDKLCRRLSLDPLDRDLFLGDPGRGEGRLFGGLVAAQSVMAAILTMDEGDRTESEDAHPPSLPHSIHACEAPTSMPATAEITMMPVSAT